MSIRKQDFHPFHALILSTLLLQLLISSSLNGCITLSCHAFTFTPQPKQQPFAINLKTTSLDATNNNFDPIYNNPEHALFGKWEEIEGNYVLRPSSSNPRALIHFLGGALVGAAPDLCYRYMLERLASLGYLIVATPFNLSFNYLASCDAVLEKFERIAPSLARQYGPVPVIGVGHSCGALLQLLITSLFPDTPRAANALISYNNKPVEEAVPLFEEVVTPFFLSVAGTNETDRSGVLALQLLIEAVRMGTAGNLPDDDFLTKLAKNLPPPFPLTSSPDIIVPDLIRSSATNLFLSPTSTTLRETGLLPYVHHTLDILDQIPSIIDEVASGARDFTPEPSSIETAIKRAYRARRTLLIQYEDDTFDETPQLIDLLQESEKIMRAKRPMINMDMQLMTMEGVHVTPLLAPPLDVANRAEDLLGEGTAKQSLLYKNADETVDVLVKWLEEAQL